jgi:hypothetical protein
MARLVTSGRYRRRGIAADEEGRARLGTDKRGRSCPQPRAARKRDSSSTESHHLRGAPAAA